MENDLISRQAAIDAPKTFTKDCNPEHFVGHSNFIEYMDTVGIRSFGNWQYANGFNMGLTAAEVAIEKLPPAQRKGKWKHEKMKHIINGEVRDVMICSVCDAGWFRYDISDNTVRCVPNFCPNCGAEMDISEG